MQNSNHLHRRVGHNHHQRRKPQDDGVLIITSNVYKTLVESTIEGASAGFSTFAPAPVATSPPSNDFRSESTPTRQPITVPTSVTSPFSGSDIFPNAISSSNVESRKETTLRTTTRSVVQITSNPKMTSSAQDSGPENDTSSAMTHLTTSMNATPTHRSSLHLSASNHAYASEWASSTASSTPSNGATDAGSSMSTGVVAGIIGGSVAVLLLILALFALIYRRKQNREAKNYTKPEDEKALNRMSAIITNERHTSPPGSPKEDKPAPKLSLRPNSNFMPGFDAVKGDSLNRKLADSLKTSVRQPPPSALKLNKENDFQGPFASPQPSPALSAFSDASTAVNGSPSPVHRVLIDFQPSMGDELELQSGELVKLLHEYDDGWVLCIRLDRSQQGVCPRSCLSQRPLKPRPPPNSRMRIGDDGSQHQNAYPNSYPTDAKLGSRPASPSHARPLTPQSPVSSRPLTANGPSSRPGSSRGEGPTQNTPRVRPPPQGQRSAPVSPRLYGRGDQSPPKQPHPLSKVQGGADVEFHAM